MICPHSKPNCNMECTIVCVYIYIYGSWMDYQLPTYIYIYIRIIISTTHIYDYQLTYFNSLYGSWMDYICIYGSLYGWSTMIMHFRVYLYFIMVDHPTSSQWGGKCLSGWWLKNHLEIWVRQWEGLYIPYMKRKIKAMFETTNQL